MKKFLFIVSTFLLSVSIYATTSKDKKNNVTKVSYTAIKQFEKEFPYAQNVVWEKTDVCVKALFTSDGKKMGALYNFQGDFLGAVEYVTYSEIPLKARTEMEAKFKNYTFTSALKIVSRPNGAYNANDVGTYWIDFSNTTKQLYIHVSPSLSVALYKTVYLETMASN